ncbi:hypothetical protein L1887_46837 [Cichorium endivia]|nr:hypothetical protein L1887_46837 [Cichorium endivia]
MQQQRFDAMTNDCQVAGEAEMRGQPPMLPSAASTRPTHITSRLPPIPSLQHNGRTNRTRSPSRGYKEGDWRAKPNLPSSNTLQTFLTVTETDHDGQVNHEHPHHHHGHDKAGMHHSSEPGHGWRVRKTPIFSGIVAPFSIMLEVPGLTSKWYAKIDADGIVERFIDNPTIVTVGLAISLGAAVVANFAIVARFLELLRPRVSIALAIAGHLWAKEGRTQLECGLLDGVRLDDHLDARDDQSHHGLCAHQRLSPRGVRVDPAAKGARACCDGAAPVPLARLARVRVRHRDRLYHCAVLLHRYGADRGLWRCCTASPGGKILVIIYAPVGIVLVALVVSAARSAILETFQAALLARNKERRRRLAQRKEARRQHKRQDRAIRRIMPRTFTFGPGTLDASGAAGDDGNDFAEALARMEKEAATSEARGSEKSAAATAGDPTLQREISALQHELLVAKQRTEQDFRQFEEHLRHEAIVAARTKLVLAASVTWAFWLLGAVAFTPWRHPQRKSEGDAPRSKSKPAQKKRRSMEACVDRPALMRDRQTSSPEALEPIILDAGESLDMPSYTLEPSSGADVITFASGEGDVASRLGSAHGGHAGVDAAKACACSAADVPALGARDAAQRVDHLAGHDRRACTTQLLQLAPAHHLGLVGLFRQADPACRIRRCRAGAAEAARVDPADRQSRVRKSGQAGGRGRGQLEDADLSAGKRDWTMATRVRPDLVGGVAAQVDKEVLGAGRRRVRAGLGAAVNVDDRT